MVKKVKKTKTFLHQSIYLDLDQKFIGSILGWDTSPIRVSLKFEEQFLSIHGHKPTNNLNGQKNNLLGGGK